MNIPASCRIVKGPVGVLGRSSEKEAACALVRAGSVTWVLLVPTSEVHLGEMAFSTAPERLIRPFPRCQPWPRQVFAFSVAVHALGFALAGWATHAKFGTLISTSSQHVTRAYAVNYLVLERPTRPVPRPERRSERRPPTPRGSVASVTAPATPSGSVNLVDSASQSAPRQPALETEALAPGATVGIGQIIPTTHSDSTGGRGLAGILGFRAPTTVGQASGDLDRVAELVGAAGSACPELRPPAAWAKRQFAVAVAFVVDTNGAVDPETLRVIQSPGHPQTDHRFQSRMYVIGASVRVDPSRIPPAAYDSVLTGEMASHMAGLVFRPAMREGRATRSTVLVSCQAS